MNKTTLLKFSALSGIVGGMTWTIGDILLVGFKPNLTDYPVIANSGLIYDKTLAVLMLEGSTNRLAAGALIAAFTVPFMFFALYHLYQLIKPAGQKYSALCTFILFVAISWSPLAHAAFFFVGETFKTAMLADEKDVETILVLGKTLTNFLYVTWIPAVSMTALGWLLVSIAVLRGKTNFPRVFAFFTPLPMSFVFILIVPLLPTILAVPFAGAMGNLAVIVFYTLTAIFCFRHQFTDS
jgi:hypothetical protein